MLLLGKPGSSCFRRPASDYVRRIGVTCIHTGRDELKSYVHIEAGSGDCTEDLNQLSLSILIIFKSSKRSQRIVNNAKKKARSQKLSSQVQEWMSPVQAKEGEGTYEVLVRPRRLCDGAMHAWMCSSRRRNMATNSFKCSMQSPACANCIRRHETCEYAGIIDGSSAIAHAHRHDCDTSKSSRHMITANSTCSPPHIRHSFPDMAFSNMSLIGTMLQAVMGRSWFTPTEAGVWSKAILGHVNEHPYLQHCIYSIAYLRRDLLDNPSDRCTSAVAYEHQMAASALFRQRTTVCGNNTPETVLTDHDVAYTTRQLGSYFVLPCLYVGVRIWFAIGVRSRTVQLTRHTQSSAH